jgi:hypothetical protein
MPKPFSTRAVACSLSTMQVHAFNMSSIPCSCWCCQKRHRATNVEQRTAAVAAVCTATHAADPGTCFSQQHASSAHHGCEGMAYRAALQLRSFLAMRCASLQLYGVLQHTACIQSVRSSLHSRQPFRSVQQRCSACHAWQAGKHHPLQRHHLRTPTGSAGTTSQTQG